MARRWQLNPPPDWPVTAQAAQDLDWRPDPAWGPLPVGWQLWRREPRFALLTRLRHP